MTVDLSSCHEPACLALSTETDLTGGARVGGAVGVQARVDLTLGVPLRAGAVTQVVGQIHTRPQHRSRLKSSRLSVAHKS